MNTRATVLASNHIAPSDLIGAKDHISELSNLHRNSPEFIGFNNYKFVHEDRAFRQLLLSMCLGLQETTLCTGQHVRPHEGVGVSCWCTRES